MLLDQFKVATTEFPEEQRESASKLIPLFRMMQHKLSEKVRDVTMEPVVNYVGLAFEHVALM